MAEPDGAAGAMPGQEIVVRVAITVTLLLYIAPVLLMLFEATGLLGEVMAKRDAEAGFISQFFLNLISAPHGPLAILQKGVGILATGGLVASLRSRRDWLLEALTIGLVAIGIVASLVLWAILSVPGVYTEVWESAGVPSVKSEAAFIAIRDSYLTSMVETLLSFGAIFIGVKLVK